MTVLIPGERAVMAKAPPWSKKGGIVWKRYHFPGSRRQVVQQQKLAKAAYGLYGQNLSRTDFIAKITSLASGGISGTPTLDQRRSSAHEASGARINARERLIAIAV